MTKDLRFTLRTLKRDYVFIFAPGLRVSDNSLQTLLKDSGGHGSSESGKRGRLCSMLVVTEIAPACVLLVGAGLLLRSFLRVLDVGLCFEPSRAAAVSLDFDDGGKAAARAAKWQAANEPIWAGGCLMALALVAGYLPIERLPRSIQ